MDYLTLKASLDDDDDDDDAIVSRTIPIATKETSKESIRDSFCSSRLGYELQHRTNAEEEDKEDKETN